MKLPKEAIIEFQELCQKKFGIVLPLDKAEMEANDFLTLMALLKEKIM